MDTAALVRKWRMPRRDAWLDKVFDDAAEEGRLPDTPFYRDLAEAAQAVKTSFAMPPLDAIKAVLASPEAAALADVAGLPLPHRRARPDELLRVFVKIKRCAARCLNIPEEERAGMS